MKTNTQNTIEDFSKNFNKIEIMKKLSFILTIFLISCAQQIVQQKPINFNDYDPIAVQYVKDGANQIDNDKNYSAAMLSFTKAIEIDPTFGKAWLARGMVKLILNQSEAALIDFDRAAELGEIEAYNIAKKIRRRTLMQQVIFNL